MGLDGIVIVNKPQGVGPFECTFKVRDALKTKQVSHIESLEPRVEGVLPIFTGKATKLLRLFKGGFREYLCEVTMGYSTTTEDTSGEKVEEKVVKRKPSIKQVEKVLNDMRGAHTQISPMYSASLFEGKKLHKYLEEGIEIPLETRPVRQVEILDIELKSTEILKTKEKLVKFSYYVKCTDGTFIRSLAVEIGRRLGYPAHLSCLKRLSVGPFHSSSAADYDTLAMRLLVLASGGDSDLILRDDREKTWFIPFEDILAPYKRMILNERATQMAKKGKRIPCEMVDFAVETKAPFIILSEEGDPLAIYALEGDMGRYHSLAVLVDR
ncbi:MAG: tRNA pseudouridine(55) synthase TruB [Defluviitaleaceae bacterium]|nr:tRNA pseudouridine(55) synthase TruB [Defluviitaleaceae bacterium]